MTQETLTGAASGFRRTTGTTGAGTSGHPDHPAADIQHVSRFTVSVNAADVVSTVAAKIQCGRRYSLATWFAASSAQGRRPKPDHRRRHPRRRDGHGFTTTTSVAPPERFRRSTSSSRDQCQPCADRQDQGVQQLGPVADHQPVDRVADDHRRRPQRHGRRHRGNRHDRWQRRCARTCDQFNQLKDQLDKTAQDASLNGINLSPRLLKLFFNELGPAPCRCSRPIRRREQLHLGIRRRP